MLYYEEIFTSIQGESRESGMPCIFVRLYGCPFQCAWCDQPQEKKQKISIPTLVRRCYEQKKKTGVDLVCITGGEPLIYEDDLMPLVYELLENDFKVSIETSGLLPIEKTMYNRSYRYIMDVKCPSSGMDKKNKYDNLFRLNHKDDVVFVVKDRTDYEFMKKTVKTYPTQAQIWVSPVCEDGEFQIGEELVEWLLKDKLANVRVQIQVHKCLGVR